MVSIDWDGITADEKEENRVWCEDFIEKSLSRLREGKESVEHDSQTDFTKMEKNLPKKLDERDRECRGGCGVMDATRFCGACKETRKSLPSSFSMNH